MLLTLAVIVLLELAPVSDWVYQLGRRQRETRRAHDPAERDAEADEDDEDEEDRDD